MGGKARRASRGEKVIDNVRWSLGAGAFVAQAAGSAASTIITAGSNEETLLRTRGNLLCVLDGVDEPGVSARIGIGIRLAQGGQATTVLSTPLTDGAAPWIWFDVFTIAYEEAVADVIAQPVASAYRAVIDSKAMWKLRPDTEVQIVVENATIVGGLTVNIFADLRFLFGD